MGGKRQFEGVRAASETTIEIDFYYAGERRRERIKLEPTPANLRRASQHRAAILDAIEKSEFDYAVTFPNSKQALKLTKVPGNALTVATYLGDWLDRKMRTIKLSTGYGYQKIVVGQLIPQFGKYKLTDLTRSSIKTWAAQLPGNNKTIANVISCLRAALQEAFEDELIESNPLAGWVYRKSEAPKEGDDVDPFSRDEQETILNALTGQGRNLIQFAFWTGLRTSELVALTWADIDWHRNVITVKRAITQAGKGKVETTKTKAGTREVKLLTPALEALKDQKQHTFLKGEEVFQNPRTLERWAGDQPIRTSLWMHALKRAGIRYRNPYQTRHTYASMMLSAGEHPMWVAQQMGHSDWGMIRRIYGRWMPEADLSAGGKAEALFAGKNVDQKADQTTPIHPKKSSAFGP